MTPSPLPRRRDHLVLAPRLTAALLALTSLLVTGCGGSPGVAASGGDSSGDSSGDSDQGLEVVVTTSILGDVVSNLVGDAGTVTVLVPPGVDPHGYEPSAAAAASLRDATLVVANGLGLEEQLASALEAARAEGIPVVEVAGELDPIAFEPQSDESQDHAHGDERRLDPHVWFDPVRMADGVDLLASELASVRPRVEADEWRERADAYRQRLLELHEEIRKRFEKIPVERRKLVSNHATFGYLAHRYDLEVVGTVLPGASPQQQVSASGFAELVERLDQEGVTTVFADHTDASALAEQLVDEAVGRGDRELEVVRVHTGALGEPGSGAESYLGLLRTTTDQIATALGS